MGSQLGANPAFDFSGYDIQHDADALATIHPAWLEAQWYRQLVTPEQTGHVLPKHQLAQFKEPFVATLTVHALASSATQVPQRTVDPHEVLHDPTYPYHSFAHAPARIGLRAQRRYGITLRMWQARWGTV